MSNDNFTLHLPSVSGHDVPLTHFPTRMQAFIFRSWDCVPAVRMAEVLGTTEENIIRQAVKMGLPADQGDLSVWMEKGYISIIRNNWYLLPYEQLETLLGWDEAKLAFVLKEDDFISHKLGFVKPVCEPIIYRELTPEEEEATALIRETVETCILPCHDDDVKEPFAFFGNEVPQKRTQNAENGVVLTSMWKIEDTIGTDATRMFAERFTKDLQLVWDVTLGGPEAKCSIVLRLDAFADEKAEYHEIDVTETKITVTASDEAGILRGLYYIEDLLRTDGALKVGKIRRRARFGARFIYSYCGLYNDAFDVDSRVWCPDELLETYSRIGVNGIWTQAVLYRMVEYPFAPSLSEGWQARQEKLLDFANRAKQYGISVYLYINEPRAMDLDFFDRYPDMKGHVRDGYASLCLENEAVAAYLENGIRQLCEKVPFLGGFFTITRSENHTNCYSHSNYETCNCPRCSKLRLSDVICKVNALVAKGAHAVNPAIKVIAWAWGWKVAELDPADKEEIITRMPKDVILMNISEEDMAYEVGGVKGNILDYSMSKIGPGEEAIKTWALAKETGHEIAAKVQLNTCWECSTTPYLPVFGLVKKHISRLKNHKVDHIMLSWTLGGYPSTKIRIASEAFFETEGAVHHADMIDIEYGADADIVRRATTLFDEAFIEFPFHLWTLYRGPQNGGVSNLLFEKPTGKQATMTCYSFDDLDGWRTDYPVDVFENQFRILAEGFEKGVKILADVPHKSLYYAALTGYSLFAAGYNQIRFVRARDRYLETHAKADSAVLYDLVKAERDLAIEVYRTMLHDPTIGYEAANHYYYTRANVAEKIVNCAYLMQKYREADV